MRVDHPRQRVLLVVGWQEDLPVLASLLPRDSWEVGTAYGVEHARFLLQMHWWDVLLLDAGLNAAAPDGLDWMPEATPPAIVLADFPAAVVLDALQQGIHWLPRTTALAHPELLVAALRQVVSFGERRRREEAMAAALQDRDRRIDRLVHMLWEVAPGQGPTCWYPQRHMLERLHEEVERAARHGGPLAMVLGDVVAEEKAPAAHADLEQLASWAARQVGQVKRRCDVAGQYGLRGFMLLLPRGTNQEAVGCCRRLQRVIAQTAEAAGDPLPPLHPYFGVAAWSPEVATVPALLSRAEHHLENARTAPGGVVTDESTA